VVLQSQLSGRHALRICSEDVFPFSFCYDAETTNEDVYIRTIQPYIQRVLDGFNANVVVLGTTSARKDIILQGVSAPSTAHEEPGKGIVHHALTGIFDKLHKRSIEVCS
jgi:hypothetical protein